MPESPQEVTEAGSRHDLVPASPTRCLNCDSALSGEYCTHCGQHVKHHVHSTPKMIGEFVEDLSHADHRVWRTLRPLLFKPGWLTTQYLRGRRVSYTPPFRLYIVLSLIFFLSASFSGSGQDDGSKLLADGQSTAAVDGAAPIDPMAQQQLEQLLARIPAESRAAARARMQDALRRVPVEQQREVAAGMIADPCSPEALQWALPQDAAARERLLEVCRTVSADNGERFAEALWHHVPQMMFFFLPLIALAAKVLYLGSRRYYAEHLLFFVHFHAFFFLAMSIRNTVGWLFGWFEGAWAGVIPGLLTAALTFYLPWYLYRAMRTVYAQGRFVTGMKFILLTLAYFVSLLLTLLGLVIFTALTLE